MRNAMGRDFTRTAWAVGLLFVVGTTLMIALSWLSGANNSGSGAYRGPYDPVEAGEELPDGYRQIVPRDAIQPIYEPVFVDAAGAGWDDEIEVIGVFFGDEAKAYPVSHLTRREIVVDELDGIPILVSW